MYEIRGTQTVEISHIQRRIAQQHAYFCMQSFLPEKKKMSDCQIGFSTQLEIRGVKKNSSKKFSRNFYLKNIEKQLLISKWLLTNHVVILHSV